MLASTLLYCAGMAASVGFIALFRRLPMLRLTTRRRAVALVAVALLGVAAALLMPVVDSRAHGTSSRLDVFVPVWQFNEVHRLTIDAPPEAVYDAIKQVRADEIAFFEWLTWIRRGGRDLPDSILDAGRHESLLDVAVKGGFVWLADDPPHEVVVGAVVIAPPGARGTVTPALFTAPPPAGYAFAAMNFVVAPAAGGSLVTTETRVVTGDAGTRRRFGAYWRVIYPGSAIIRRMWLRAVASRAVGEKPRA